MKKFAFTLAEVLITLGVIGVVASMTIPALIQHHRKTVVETSLKKFYSVMSQAIKMSELDNGYMQKDSAKMLEDGTKDWDANKDYMENFFIRYLAPYVKYVKIYERDFQQSSTVTRNLKAVVFSDGSVVGLNNGDCFDFRYDINGDREPNEAGRDIFGFLLCTDAYMRNYYCGSESVSFCANGNFGKNRTQEWRMERCKNSGLECSGFIEANGWKIPDNYPYKL